MTDATDETKDVPKWDEENDPDGMTRKDITPKDWALDTLLHFIVGFNDDGDDGSIGLTVTCGGATVSGITISRKQWLDGMSKTFHENATGDLADNLDKVWKMYADNAIDKAKERDAANLPSRRRGFIHMRDARIHENGGINVPFWRGNLDDVTSWSLGSHNPPGSGKLSDD